MTNDPEVMREVLQTMADIRRGMFSVGVVLRQWAVMIRASDDRAVLNAVAADIERAAALPLFSGDGRGPGNPAEASNVPDRRH